MPTRSRCFFRGANPKNWPAAAMKEMMHYHLNLTTCEAVSRLHGDWSSDIKGMTTQMGEQGWICYVIGIASQFPKKFDYG
jgi:hypothetical protein